MSTATTTLSPQRALARLKTLVGEAGARHYERVQLADGLLSNAAWITEQHGGDDYTAAQVLEDRYFHDLCGTFSIFNLLAIYRKFPTLKEWEEHDFHLGSMYELTRPKEQRANPSRRIKLKDYEEVENKAKSLEFQVKKELSRVKELEAKVAKLEQENERLQRRNERLEGRVEELEKVIDKWGAKQFVA